MFRRKVVPHSRLTANNYKDWELSKVGLGYHHAGESLLVFKCGLGDEQVEPVVDADSLGIIIGGLNCGLLTAALFDQQIARCAIFPFLRRQKAGVNQ